MNYRSEVFNLCKKLQEKEGREHIQSLVHELSVSTENRETSEIQQNPRGDFVYVAKHSHNQFMGYLFVDDNLDTLSFPVPLKVGHLTLNERKLIERAHATLSIFISCCLDDIKPHYPVIASVLNPYSNFPPVKTNPQNSSLLSLDELKPVAKAFKNGSIYRKLTESKYFELFNHIDKNKLLVLFQMISREMDKGTSGDVPKDIADFALSLSEKYKDVTKVMFACTILMYCLRKSLCLACELFYEALCGEDLIVLNNDNIINLNNTDEDVLYKKFTVLMQGAYFSLAADLLDRIALVDCDPPNRDHIHEFGMIVAATTSIRGEMGDSTKLTLATVNEELNPISLLTNEILRSELPQIEKR